MSQILDLPIELQRKILEYCCCDTIPKINQAYGNSIMRCTFANLYDSGIRGEEIETTIFEVA